MKPQFLWLMTVVLASVLILDRTRPTRACGPFFFPPVFSETNHPDSPFAAYARGQLGLLEPRYQRTYLYVAYRNLAGPSFTEEEVHKLNALGENQATDNPPAPPTAPEDWPRKWSHTRSRVIGIGQPPYLHPWSSPEGLYRQ